MQTTHGDRIDLVTISREFGAGGSELASALGEQLGWPVLDHELIHQVAERLELDEAAVEKLDERPPNWLARIAAMLLIAPPEAPLDFDHTGVLTPDAIATATHAVIVEAVQHRPLIVVGHGAQAFLAQVPGALHIRLFAPMASRVHRLRARYGWSDTTAIEQARKMDEARRGYVQRYYHRDWDDPLLYDLHFNTGRMSIGEAVTLLDTLIRAHGTEAAAV